MKQNPQSKNLETLCVHGADYKSATGAVSTPIYQSATFTHPELGASTGFDYTRLQNPTRAALEQALAKLENGIDAIAYTSGMAAITNLLELFSPNDHIIASEDLYGGAIRLFRQHGEKNGLTFTFIDTSNLESIKNSITKNTKAIFVESPTNPMMIISDIKQIAKIAKNNNITFIVDNTFLTPVFLQPLNLGADIVVHSGTKYLCGHNDTLAGCMIFKSQELAERARVVAKTIGACLAPLDSWLMIRGLKTLALRMQKHGQNAMAVAEFLSTHKKIKKVFYPGLANHPNHNILKTQSTGFGGMVSFEVDSHDTLKQVLKRVKVFAFAESLGGVESLITYPSVQTHADVPEHEKQSRGINNRLMRASIGIESIDDLIADLTQALG